MNILLRKDALVFSGAGIKIFAIGIAASLLWGCGGDSGIDIGSGQSGDPVVLDYPMFYVKRPHPVDDAGLIIQPDARELLAPELGADLFMRVRAAAGAPEMNLTGALTNRVGDVRDVSVSHDGALVLFSMRFPIDPDADPEDQPTWDIWEYNIGADSLRRIFTDDILAEGGHDLGAEYLPDGRIVFTSTRQNQSLAKLVDERKPQFAALDEDQEEPAFVLHVMNDDGTGLVQISFNQSHDLYPTVLDNGRILFTRWDAAGGNDGMALYSSNPDGTDLQMHYGSESHATGTLDPATQLNGTVQFLKPRELPDGRIIALALPFTDTFAGGDIITIDADTYINNAQPNVLNVGLVGPAQQPASNQPVSTNPGVSPGGRFTSVWPLWDGTNRALISWALCGLHILPANFDPVNDPLPPVQLCTTANLADPQAIAAVPAYGVWSLDLLSQQLRPVLVPEPGMIMTDIVIAQARVRQTVVLDLVDAGTADDVLLNEEAGILHIRSVYDFDGVDNFGIAALSDPAVTNAAGRPARFIRVYKAVGIPDEDTLDFDQNSAFGVSSNQGMREIIGYAPVEPDGSVMVKVPADVPLAIDVLDVDGRRIFPQHQNWIQMRPGEVRECSGCHDPNSQTAQGISHGRNDAFNAVNTGAPSLNYRFPNTDLGTLAETGETMAANRVRQSCFTDCAVRDLSIDLKFDDPWTDPTVPLTPDVSFRLAYDAYEVDGVLVNDGLETQPPQRNRCVPWTINCRVVINYEEHIQPLWELDRIAIDPDPLSQQNRCTDCHALRDRAGVLLDPTDDRGQLELTSIPSTQDANQYKSYRELLSGDDFEILDPATATVRDDLVFQGNFDVDGITPLLEPVAIGSPLSIAGAASRPAFFARFVNHPTHAGWLSEAELRLLAEWLDLGGQYFNDPFNPAVPLN